MVGISWVGATSILLVIALVLFVASPQIFRTQSNSSIAAERFAEDIYLDSATGVEGEPLSHTSFSSHSERAVKDSSKTEAPFKIFWGRVAIFGIGSLALMTAFITALLALVTSFSWVLPAVAMLVACGCLVTLRLLAIRDAKKLGRSKATHPYGKSPSAVVLKPRSVTDDTEMPRRIEIDPEPRRLKPQKREGQIPVNYAAKSLRFARTHREPQRQEIEKSLAQPLKDRRLPEEPFENSVEQWEPTPVPEPVYTDFELKRPENAASVSTHFALPAPVQQLDIVSGASLDEILGRRRRS